MFGEDKELKQLGTGTDDSKQAELRESLVISNFSIEEEENDMSVVKTLIKVTMICACFMVIEFVGGYISDSVAVISDALHLGVDVIGYIVQILSAYYAKKSKNRVILRTEQEVQFRVHAIGVHRSHFQRVHHLGPHHLFGHRGHLQALPPFQKIQSESHAFYFKLRRLREPNDGSRSAWLFHP
jgi:hypothetical protein